MASWSGNQSLITPLLGTILRRDHPEESTIHIGTDDRDAPPLQQPPDAPIHFLRRLYLLLAELRPYQALLLAALSIIESLIVAQVGKVAGSFYQIVVDKQPGALLTAGVHVSLLYSACVLTAATGVFLSGRLAVQWRDHLTSVLHHDFCTNLAFLHLPSSLDNPDQRITAETAALCDAFAATIRLAAGAPFRVFYYSFVAWRYLHWRGLLAAFAFFWVGAVVQRFVVVPFAHCLVVQEKKEGNLRYMHLRLRDKRDEVAAYRGGSTELLCLQQGLCDVVSNQKQLVTWRTAVAAVTKAADYSGALLNYGLVAAAVFSGAAGAVSPGELAQFVSNASFASLSLIYSFTELLDLGEQVSVLAALSARVVGLLEALKKRQQQCGNTGGHYFDGIKINEGNGGSSGSNSSSSNTRRRESAPNNGTNNTRNGSRELQASGLATMLQPPLTATFFSGALPLEYSVHALGHDLQIEARKIFLDAPPFRSTESNLICVLTFQFAGGGAIDLSPDRSTPTLSVAAAEMDRLLERFLRWEGAVREALMERGCWCDAIDPRSGLALHGSQGLRWSEVAAARALLQYDRRDFGICPLVVHPVHGTSAYPASFFTDAPPEILFKVLSSLADDPLLPPHLPRSQPPLLAVEGLSFSTPDGRKNLISNLTLAVHPGHNVLISGPNGAGKSTFLRVLSGLQSSTAGSILFSTSTSTSATTALSTSSHHRLLLQKYPFEDSSAAMLLPQRPLSAPGATLWQQITYPGSIRFSDNVLCTLLSAVGLGHLLEQAGGDLGATHPVWATSLSPGEMQRLAIARVLLHRPKLVLLDEPFSAMSDVAAKELLELLRGAGVTCVTVAQDTEVYREMHAVQLRMGVGVMNGWQVEEQLTR